MGRFNELGPVFNLQRQIKIKSSKMLDENLEKDTYKPIQTINRIAAVMARHPHIDQVILFGSLATGKATPDSDLDLAVASAAPLSPEIKGALIADLAENLGRPVDLIDLNQVGEPLLGQILRHGRRVLGSNQQYARLLSKHLFNMADFAPYRSRILAERRRAWIGT